MIALRPLKPRLLQSRRSGFTLLEVLVAVSILGLGLLITSGAIMASLRAMKINELRSGAAFELARLLEDDSAIPTPNTEYAGVSKNGLYSWQITSSPIVLPKKTVTQPFGSKLLKVTIRIEWTHRQHDFHLTGNRLASRPDTKNGDPS